MSSLLEILVWGCALIIASSAIQVLREQINEASLRSRDGGKVRQAQGEYKANLSQVLIQQDEKDELLEKLNAKVFPPELNTTVAPQPEEKSTGDPPTSLQVYLSSGVAGLIGKPLNIENELYKGEFLYLARNPCDRSANVNYDGATLAVSGDKLRESAFQWELLPVPGEDRCRLPS